MSKQKAGAAPTGFAHSYIITQPTCQEKYQIIFHSKAYSGISPSDIVRSLGVPLYKHAWQLSGHSCQKRLGWNETFRTAQSFAHSRAFLQPLYVDHEIAQLDFWQLWCVTGVAWPNGKQMHRVSECWSQVLERSLSEGLLLEGIRYSDMRGGRSYEIPEYQLQG